MANIQHGKAQSAFLCKRIIECQIKIALIQEPWVYHGKVRGLGRAGGTVYYCPSAEEPRACILVKGAKGVFPMPGLCTKDLAVIKLAIGKGNTKREVAICSAYFPRNTESPPRELSDLIRYCEGIGLPLLVGCDSNSHHTMWGDKEVKPRGRMLLEFLTLSGMQIANRGSVPTYFTPERQSRVSLEVSLSDHRHIFFGLDESTQLIENGYRNPRATQWDLYLEDLKGRLIEFHPDTKARQTLRTSSSKTPWWNSHVESYMRKDTWRASCEDIIQLPSAARLSKVLTKDPGAKLGAVSLPDGGFTSSAGETLQHCSHPKLGIQIPSRDDWDNTNNTICQNGIIWFTDGSKIGDKAGAGAEIYAILACGMEILKTAPKKENDSNMHGQSSGLDGY
ncbi:hypothetical protein NQ318_002394 [Aromia moschata]|uniref:Endonuclease/exonuclease/phosphatase domain-containing protein n=1 Tax=Aromia moschata TaxID=1265417 RepID=A0AAV8YG85_9CUCU|nr:hypothetical protein NQ318_002394 [Aromia moschata]